PSMSLESEPDQPPGQRRRLLDDPVVIRALAHPLRLDLLSFVLHNPASTTADAARELDISHGLASHHLRQLAKYGFVEQIDGKDHRERPWRAVSTGLSWPTTDDSETAVAGRVLERIFAERGLRRLLDWHQRMDNWDPAWHEISGMGQNSVYLTLPELTELMTTVRGAIQHYIAERPLDDVASRPPGSVPVDITMFVVPLEPAPEA
ncbi:MAG TPA: helix-turn-helix domain-containing protein, partial [Micromonosporaceae bacterium]